MISEQLIITYAASDNNSNSVCTQKCAHGQACTDTEWVRASCAFSLIQCMNFQPSIMWDYEHNWGWCFTSSSWYRLINSCSDWAAKYFASSYKLWEIFSLLKVNQSQLSGNIYNFHLSVQDAVIKNKCNFAVGQGDMTDSNWKEMRRIEIGRVKSPVWNTVVFYLRNTNSKFMAPEHEPN